MRLKYKVLETVIGKIRHRYGLVKRVAVGDATNKFFLSAALRPIDGNVIEISLTLRSVTTAKICCAALYDIE